MNRIKELRVSRGLSQSELAKAINVHQTAISQWEKDRTSPDISSALLLADYFNVSTDYILGRANFSARFKAELKRKCITQRGLADMIGVTTSAISRYINEERTPNAELLAKIALALDVSSDYLLYGSDKSDDEQNTNVVEQELTVREFLAQKGITNEKDIESMNYLLELMQKNKANEELADEFISKEYNRK